MANLIQCPECAATGVITNLEEEEGGETFRCPNCSARFSCSRATSILKGAGFGMFMGVCSSVLFGLLLIVSPMNAPWYYFAVGLAVLIGAYELLSRTVFQKMVNRINQSSLRKINGED